MFLFCVCVYFYVGIEAEPRKLGVSRVCVFIFYVGIEAEPHKLGVSLLCVCVFIFVGMLPLQVG